MITKSIEWFGRACTFACDRNCGKAWGINSRPKVELDPSNPDDYAFLADDELETAPEDPGWYEGGHAKPTVEAAKPNKWCVRECERSRIFEDGEEIKLPDLSQRLFNIQRQA